MDLEGKILECNRATSRFLNKPLNEIIGRSCFEVVHGFSERIEGCPIDRMFTSKHRESLIIKSGDRWFDVTVDPLFDETGRLTGGVHIISDITEHKQAEEEKQKTLITLRKAMGGIIQAMALTVETRDPYTAGHQRRVADLARAMAQEMGLSEDRIDGIRMAGIVHDLGKISIPAEILSKPTPLNELEFALIKIHPQASYDILKDIEFSWPVAQMVLQHHERMNGSGYPQGLKGEEILIEARVLAVADVVEAIASHRPYRPAYGIGVALQEIEEKKGVLYDPVVVEACLKLFKEKGFVLERI